MQPQAMLLTRALPQPGQRAYRLLQTLVQAGFDVHLVGLLGAGQRHDDYESLRGLCKTASVYPAPPTNLLRATRAWLKHQPATVACAGHPELAAKVAAMLPKAQLIAATDAVHHPLILRAAGGLLPEAFYLLDLGEPLSLRLVTQATARWGVTGWALRSEAKMLRTLEYQAANAASLTLVNDEIDLQLIAEHAKRAKLWTVHEGVTVPQSVPQDTMFDLPDTVLFCGDLCVPAHQRAATWLARTVLPKVRANVRGAKLVLMDAAPPAAMRRLGGLDGVEVVDLDALAPGAEALRMSRCVAGIAPQRQARGAAQRTLMMMALGRPVVTTSAVARTLPDETAAGPLLAESTAQFVDAICRVLGDRKLATQSGAQARRLVRECGTWEQQWRRVGATLAQVAMKQPVKIRSDRPDPRDLAELRSAVRMSGI